MYPVIVVLLVEKNRSLNPTYSLFGTLTDVCGGEPISFEPRPVLASGGQIGLTGPPSDCVTLDSILEPEDTEMDVGSSKILSEMCAA
jgi:hypothetical protein